MITIITDAKYRVKRAPNGTEVWRCIECTVDGVKCSVPIDELNTIYKEIMRQVEADELVIAPADEPEGE
jgi:multimeric flavodoxin WrbA